MNFDIIVFEISKFIDNKKDLKNIIKSLSISKKFKEIYKKKFEYYFFIIDINYSLNLKLKELKNLNEKIFNNLYKNYIPKHHPTKIKVYDSSELFNSTDLTSKKYSEHRYIKESIFRNGDILYKITFKILVNIIIHFNGQVFDKANNITIYEFKDYGFPIFFMPYAILYIDVINVEDLKPYNYMAELEWCWLPSDICNKLINQSFIYIVNNKKCLIQNGIIQLIE